MQKTSVLTLGTILLPLIALIACRATSRIQSATHLLPVGRFPQTVGVWRSMSETRLDPAVQQRIPTARVEERTYQDRAGRQWDLLLLTATDDQDFHHPTACLPGQGWNIEHSRVVTVDGRPANLMRVSRDGQSFMVLYYWVKLVNKTAPPPNSLFGRIYRMRQFVDHESLSLFVRITVPDAPDNRLDLLRFAGDVWNALGPVLGDKGEVVLG